MPGIAGIISRKPSSILGAELDSMLRLMRHEPFYATGSYQNPEMGVYAGWAVHENSFSDCLPVCNRTKDVVLLFYGENLMDSRSAEACARRHPESTGFGNAEYLMQVYEEDEESFLPKLNGLFCGLIVDARRKRSIVFNDRFGMQRVYFHETDDTFYFASEAKCLLKIRPELRNISIQGLSDVLACGCVLGNESLFTGVSLLPGGSCWEAQQGGPIRRRRYFDPGPYESLPAMGEEDWYPALRATVRDVLPKYFVSKEPVALSLTGGLDTRTMLANAPDPLPLRHCYTHSGGRRDCYDAVIAKQVADSCGLTHHRLKMDGGFISDFPDLAWKTVFISDGCMDLNGAPSLYLHKKAREFCGVRLTGNYGDQVLAGRVNLRLASAVPPGFNDEIRPYWARSAERYRHETRCHPLSFFLFKQAPWFDFGRYAAEQSQLVQRTPYLDTGLIELLYRSPGDMRASGDLRMRLIRDGSPRLFSIPTERGALGHPGRFRTSGLHLYRKWLFQMEYYFGYGMPHWLARLNECVDFLKLDAFFLDRNKYYSYRRWFRHELADYLRDVLLDGRTFTRPCIDKKAVTDMVRSHTSGKGNYTNPICRLLSLELTYRSLLDTP